MVQAMGMFQAVAFCIKPSMSQPLPAVKNTKQLETLSRQEGAYLSQHFAKESHRDQPSTCQAGYKADASVAPPEVIPAPPVGGAVLDHDSVGITSDLQVAAHRQVDCQAGLVAGLQQRSVHSGGVNKVLRRFMPGEVVASDLMRVSLDMVISQEDTQGCKRVAQYCQ